MEILFIGWAFLAGIGYLIGSVKGNGAFGLFLGFLLGPLGWLIVVCLPDSRPKCRLCHGALDDEKVMRCKHCGGERPLSNPTSQAGQAAKYTKKDPFQAWEEQEEAVETAKKVGLPPIQRKPEK